MLLGNIGTIICPGIRLGWVRNSLTHGAPGSPDAQPGDGESRGSPNSKCVVIHGICDFSPYYGEISIKATYGGVYFDLQFKDAVYHSRGAMQQDLR